MDSFLGQRFQLPIALGTFPELDAVLSGVALDLVEHRLRMRRPPAPAEVAERAEQAVEWLRLLAEGKVSLPSAAEVPTSTSRGVVAKSSGRDRLLTAEEFAGF